MCYNYCMLYQRLLVRNDYEQTIMNGLKAKKKDTSMNTMFYKKKRIFFSAKRFFPKICLSVLTLLKAAKLHV